MQNSSCYLLHHSGSPAFSLSLLPEPEVTQPHRMSACFSIALANRRSDQSCHPPFFLRHGTVLIPPLMRVPSPHPSLYTNTTCSGEAVLVKFTLLCITNLYYYSFSLLPFTVTGLILYAYTLSPLHLRALLTQLLNLSFWSRIRIHSSFECLARAPLVNLSSSIE